MACVSVSEYGCSCCLAHITALQFLQQVFLSALSNNPQRDRPIIKDLLVQIEQYCRRNLQKRDEKLEAERRRQHEAQHAQLVGAEDTEQTALTAGQADQEEEQEVDPLIVGSLDDVYKDEPGTEMKEEDPFKDAPVMDEHEKPSSMMEMEKSLDAMVARVEHTPGSPVPDDSTNLDTALRNSTTTTSNNEAPPGGGAAMEEGKVPLGLPVSAQQSADLMELGGDTTPTSEPIELSKGLVPPLVSS